MLLYEHPLLIANLKSREQVPIVLYLSSNLKRFSRMKINDLISQERILVNGCSVNKEYLVKSNDVITLVSPYQTINQQITPQNIPVAILFEDEHIIVAEKPAGMAVHPGLGDYNNTLLNALLYTQKKEKTLPDAIKIVHRLDKLTSGAIVCAKTPEALKNLSGQFLNHSVLRTYYTLVTGIPAPKNGIIDTYMGRNPENEKIIQVAPNKSFGKHAITHYETIETYTNASLVKCILQTGRTHQIRIHMQHIGHALINDPRYPDLTDQTYKELIMAFNQVIPHHFLHAQTLGFKHPISNKELFFESPFPPYYSLLINNVLKKTE